MRTSGEIIERILADRGITSAEDVSEFLSDRPQKTYDPFLLLNMEAGVDLLLSEAESGGKICIYGDYDADGVTSICVLSHALRMLTDNLTYYIPSRFDEGYGLNTEAIKKIRDDGADLLITVDCGSVSYDEVEYAKSIGLKVIVTDHHNVDGARADCLLINPKQHDCPYPFKELAGCGVAFKMVQAICRRKGLPKSVITEVLDMAAIGTVSDIVSLTDENRTIVKYGLMKANEGSRRALKLLMDAVSLRSVTSENIAFGIAPHINAAGRMEHADVAAELFLTADEAMMRSKVEELVQLNADRRKKQDEAYDRCMSMVSGDESFIILRTDEIHEGIAGIVAGKIKDAEHKPVIIVTPSGSGQLKGTGRSTEKVDIFAMLKRHDELFIRFGGHRSACGFLMDEEDLEALWEALTADMEAMIEEDPGIADRDISWDIEISPGEITVELARDLERLQPFGQGNRKPVFMIKGAVPENVRFMGEREDHAGFRAAARGEAVESVLFRKAQDNRDVLLAGEPADITGTIGLREWMGRESVQFVVEEIISDGER